ncbi:MAG: hypothetical protein HY901_18820 [Deltaproteobacteria bacterium]|nr:hypothetical protein [Deltaproteobacteria bacterium]
MRLPYAAALTVVLLGCTSPRTELRSEPQAAAQERKELSSRLEAQRRLLLEARAACTWLTLNTRGNWLSASAQELRLWTAAMVEVAPDLGGAAAGVSRVLKDCEGHPESLAGCDSEWSVATCDRFGRIPIDVPWRCTPLAPRSTTAVCTRAIDIPPQSRYLSVGGLPTHREVLRVAYFAGGRLRGADWPAYDPDLYEALEPKTLADCTEETNRRRCRRNCGENDNPCNTFQFSGKMGDLGPALEEDGHGDDEPTDDPQPIVDPEAERRQCLEDCETPPEESSPPPTAPGTFRTPDGWTCYPVEGQALTCEPTRPSGSSQVSLIFLGSPAPGLFWVRQETREGNPAVKTDRRTLLLSVPAPIGKAEEEPVLRGLDLVAELVQQSAREDWGVAWTTIEGRPTAVGRDDAKRLVAIQFNAQGFTPIGHEKVCGAPSRPDLEALCRGEP